MSVILYNIFLFFYRLTIHLISPFNKKAAKWIRGRKNIFEKLEQAISKEDKLIWMHCASLGEFEQGRPLLELIKKKFKHYKILLTFFSPSGFEAQKNYQGADWIFYLPMDGPVNAKRFLEITHPDLVIFVKYEFWYYYLKKIKYRKIPIILISALFRKDMSFFKWYGGLSRKMLSRFDHLFVQNESSLELLKKIDLADISSVSGDTRFDRVIEIAEQKEAVPYIEYFLNGHKVIVAGSTWIEDEESINRIYSSLAEPVNWIIAPHEISSTHIEALKKMFPSSLTYSELKETNLSSNVLIIDCIGILSRLYRYAYITYVGGGLKIAGVHNVLEAAVYYKPVVFGNYFEKYTEAIGLVKSGGGLPFSDPKKNGQMLRELLNGLLKNEEEYNYCSRAAGEFVHSQTGATQKIINYLQEKRLLTS